MSPFISALLCGSSAPSRIAICEPDVWLTSGTIPNCIHDTFDHGRRGTHGDTAGRVASQHTASDELFAATTVHDRSVSPLSGDTTTPQRLAAPDTDTTKRTRWILISWALGAVHRKITCLSCLWRSLWWPLRMRDAPPIGEFYLMPACRQLPDLRVSALRRGHIRTLQQALQRSCPEVANLPTDR